MPFRCLDISVDRSDHIVPQTAVDKVTLIGKLFLILWFIILFIDFQLFFIGLVRFLCAVELARRIGKQIVVPGDP